MLIALRLDISHVPVVYRSQTFEELEASKAQSILKVVELARQSGKVVCLPISPIISKLPTEGRDFWAEVSALPMCQAEISALPMCANGNVGQEEIILTLSGKPRLESEWRKDDKLDDRDRLQTPCVGTLAAKVLSLVGMPFDERSISPSLRALYPKILWLLFHPVGPCGIEMISLPHIQDIFDYDAFGAVPREFCALCERQIPAQIIHTPCAFHLGS